MSKLEEKYVALKDDFLSKPLYPIENVRLKGSKCQDCGQVFFGKMFACDNCQSMNMEEIVLSNRGKLYSYTVNRHSPPGDYKGARPPYAVGLVELPEGIAILTPLVGCEFDTLKVGMDVELVVGKLYEDTEGNEVISFSFRPLQSKAKEEP